MATLELRGLNKTFDDGTQAVRDVDLTVADGELFVIVGPSGCGKTTLLRMVAGLEEVTAGDVVVDGNRINDVRVDRRDIAMAFQHHALYPHMTVAENIGFPLHVDRVHQTVIDRRVADTARDLRLEEVLDRRPAQLSGGQRQRTGLARSIIRHPRLLLMDEPMSNLDAKLRTETRFVVAELQRRLGITTLHVTHDQDEAMAMGNRMAVMRDGRLVQVGSPMSVYEDPVDLFVAQFVGAPAMNAFVATVDTVDDLPALRIGPDVLPLGEAGRRRFTQLGGMTGRSVVVGIRPDDIRQASDGPLGVSVMSSEQFDRTRLLSLRLDAPTVLVGPDGPMPAAERTSTVVMAVGLDVPVNLWTPFRVELDVERLQLFDLTTGGTLATGRPDDTRSVNDETAGSTHPGGRGRST